MRSARRKALASMVRRGPPPNEVMARLVHFLAVVRVGRWACVGLVAFLGCTNEQVAEDASASDQAFGECGPEKARCAPLGLPLTLTVPQNSYARVNAEAFENLVYVYVPEIRSLRGLSPFDVWVVEGIYGPPFLQEKDSLAEEHWEQIRPQLEKSGNVWLTPIRVTAAGEAQTFEIRGLRSTYRLEVENVSTPLLGRDGVTLRIRYEATRPRPQATVGE